MAQTDQNSHPLAGVGCESWYGPLYRGPLPELVDMMTPFQKFVADGCGGLKEWKKRERLIYQAQNHY